MRDADRVAAWSGLAAAVVGVGAVTLATLVAAPETFTWRTASLSDMGHYEAETFWLFNGGLVGAGLLGVPFGWLLWRAARNRVERVGVVLTGVAVVGLAGVGVFYLGHTAYYLDVQLHFHAAITLFVAAPLAQVVFGAGQALAGDGRRGAVSVGFGLTQVAGWVVWIGSRTTAGSAADAWTWFAIPEYVAALAFGAWIAVLAGWLATGGARVRNAKSGAVESR